MTAAWNPKAAILQWTWMCEIIATFCAQWLSSKTSFIIHPVSVRRFPSFRTQPLENLTPLPMNKWVPEQPSPWRKSSKRESCFGDWV